VLIEFTIRSPSTANLGARKDEAESGVISVVVVVVNDLINVLCEFSANLLLTAFA
jgi:hypothetical protein